MLGTFVLVLVLVGQTSKLNGILAGFAIFRVDGFATFPCTNDAEQKAMRSVAQ